MSKRSDRRRAAREASDEVDIGAEGAGDAAGLEGEAEDAGVTTADPEIFDMDASDEEDTPGHIDAVAPPAVELDSEQELEELRDRHLRLAAEFDNFRRRTRRELEETGDRGRAELAAKLLEVVDDLQRVAATPVEGTTTEVLHQGIELVARKLGKTLADAGMEAVDPKGERFDPNFHEALFISPTDDPEQDETVSEVILVGYRLGDRLLRPAQVGVFRHEEEHA